MKRQTTKKYTNIERLVGWLVGGSGKKKGDSSTALEINNAGHYHSVIMEINPDFWGVVVVVVVEMVVEVILGGSGSGSGIAEVL